MIKRIARKIKRTILPKSGIVTYHNSYSQAGEDLILSFLFTDKKMSSISYLDIGAGSPVYSNNTYLLYTKGNKGVCVEADKSLIPAIKEVRPKDKVINAGVAVSDLKEADFYTFEIKGLNTFDKAEAEKRAALGT